MSVQIGSANVARPGVFPLNDTTAMTPLRPGEGGAVLVVGVSDGGPTGKVLEFRSPEDAFRVLRGGRILSYISRIFNPSKAPGRNGASVVRFIRAQAATPAALDTAGNGFQLVVTARDSGAWTNGLRYSVVRDGSASATLKTADSTGTLTAYTPATIKIEFPPERVSNAYRILAGVVVTCSDVGTNRILVNQSTRTARLITGGVVEDVDLATIPTLREFAQWINAHPAWTATIEGSGWLPVEVLNGTPGADSTAPKIGASAAFLPAEEGLAAWLLSTQDPLVRASVSSCPTTLVAKTFAPLTGGTGRATDSLTTQNLTTALDMASTVDAQHIFVQSAVEAHQVLLTAHCAEMGRVQRRRYRIGYTGVNWATLSGVGVDDGSLAGPASVDAAVDAACLLARKLDGPVLVGFSGTLARNPITGLQEQLGGLGYAAQMCGMAAGSNASEPLTNKPLAAEGTEFPILTDAQIERLVLAGVSVPVYDPNQNATVTVLALTCHQTQDVSFRKLQGLRIQHEIFRMWIRVLAKYVGSEMDLTTGLLIKGDCVAALNSAIRSGQNKAGFLTPGRKNGVDIPAWENLQVRGDGIDLWDIRVDAHPVGESDYILVTTKLSPVSIEL